MNSSCLCVIVIGLLLQVFAQDKFHSRLWRMNLHKINEEIEKRKAFKLAVHMVHNDPEDEDTLPPPPPPEETKAHLVCADKTGVSPRTIMSIKSGDWKDGDPKAKNWVQCVLVETKLMTDQSIFRQDVALKYWSGSDKRTLIENIDHCLPSKTMTPVEKSWIFAQCFQAADPWNSVF